MPISQGTGGGLPGMSLKAWALLSPAGAVIKSFNIASVVATADGSGFRKVTFSAAMSGTNYLARMTPLQTGSSYLNPFSGGIAQSKAKTTAECVVVYSFGTNAAIFETGGLWEFYE